MSAPVSGSTRRAWVFGTSGPMLERSMSSRSSEMRFAAGLVSVIPQPCVTGQPSRFATAAGAPSSGVTNTQVVRDCAP